MHLRALPLLVVPVAVVIGLTTAPAVAATPASVAYPQIAGSGPGDLIRVRGAGFTARATVSIELVSTATVDPPVPTALATVRAAATGAVNLPAGTRVPLTVTPGGYRVRMTQQDGTVTAVSPVVVVSVPRATMPSTVQPGTSDFPRPPGAMISLAGLANTPDVVRAVTIDGVAATSTRWYSDENAFSTPGIAFAVPSSLTVGEHEVTFTQTGESTPYTATGTVSVPVPVISLSGPFAPAGRFGISIAHTAWDDDFDVSIVGAAGDRHAGLEYLVTQRPDGSSTTTSQFDVEGLSPGTATMTVVSRRNQATAQTTFVVDAATVTSPAGLAPGQRVVSADGNQQLLMQTDGNLVQRSYGQYAEWSSGTQGHPGARLSVQTDGNVVIRDVNGRALWTTGTAGVGASVRFGLDGQGQPTVFAATGRRAWSSFTPFGGDLLDRLAANGYLFKGQSVIANLRGGPGGALYFALGGDGNVVVRGDHQGVLWSTHTAGHNNAYLILQTDGNLVLRDPNGASVWANGVRGVAGARLVAQSDGNVVEYAPNGTAVWSTRTHVS